MCVQTIDVINIVKSGVPSYERGERRVRLSAAKALVRQYFYKQFLPSQLPLQLVQTGNYLVLLGDELGEAQLLQELGVPGRNIHSVESKLAILERQMIQMKRGNLQAAMLYFGELSTFIRNHLYSNQSFQVLNLDICGSYLHHIDPVMTPVLLFARRNPKTVIATYTNVGRDRLQLGEGLKSLTLFYWLAPEVTMQVAETLFARYRACGMRPLTAFTMILRHMFWVRSHFEHILAGQVMIGPTRLAVAQNLLGSFEEVWSTVRKSLRHGFTHQDILRAVAKQKSVKQLPPVLDLNIQHVVTATYEAIDIAYHSAWFCTYQRVHLMEPVMWAEQALLSLIAQPLLFASGETDVLIMIEEPTLPIPPRTVIWKKVQLIQGRALPMPRRSRQFAALRTTAPAVVASPAPAILQSSEVREEVKRPMPNRTVRSQGDTNHKISPAEIARLLARQGFTTDDIAEMVPDISRSSIRAYVAHASRSQNHQ